MGELYMMLIIDVLCLQVTIVLVEELRRLDPDIVVNVRTFEEGQGVAGLGDDPFVSWKFYEILAQ